MSQQLFAPCSGCRETWPVLLVEGKLRFEGHTPRSGRCPGGVPLAAEVLRGLERRRRALSETVAGFAAKRAAAVLAHNNRVAEIDRLEVEAQQKFSECLAAIATISELPVR